MNLTLYWSSAPWWEWDDWKAYADWTLKARFNILSLWDTPGEDVAWNKAWKRLGLEISDHSYSGPPYGIFAPIKYGVRPPLSSAWREAQSELNKKVIKYLRAHHAVGGSCGSWYRSSRVRVLPSPGPDSRNILGSAAQADVPPSLERPVS